MTICHDEASIVSTCQHLHSLGLLAACDGNVSILSDEGHIVMTPSGMRKADIETSDLATVTLDGEVLSGSPSSELSMHLTVYRNCPEARAVIHAHPPIATAWSVARTELDELPCTCLSEVILATGGIPIVPYARPGSADLSLLLQDYLPSSKVMILQAHGSLTWGTSLQEAFWGNGTPRTRGEDLALRTAVGRSHSPSRRRGPCP